MRTFVKCLSSRRLDLSKPSQNVLETPSRRNHFIIIWKVNFFAIKRFTDLSRGTELEHKNVMSHKTMIGVCVFKQENSFSRTIAHDFGHGAWKTRAYVEVLTTVAASRSRHLIGTKRKMKGSYRLIAINIRNKERGNCANFGLGLRDDEKRRQFAKRNVFVTTESSAPKMLLVLKL